MDILDTSVKNQMEWDIYTLNVILPLIFFFFAQLLLLLYDDTGGWWSYKVQFASLLAKRIKSLHETQK